MLISAHRETGGDTMVDHIHWLGHDTFKIVGKEIIYTDPFKIKQKDTADIILITHEHFDHCSPEDVKALLGGDTIIVAPPDCAYREGQNSRTR